VWPKLHFVGYVALGNSLRIGVGNNKVYAVNVLAVHVVNGIGAAAANTNHLDDG